MMQISSFFELWGIISPIIFVLLVIFGVLLVVMAILKEKYGWNITGWITEQSISDIGLWSAVLLVYLSMFLYQVPLLVVGTPFIPIEAFLVMQFGSPVGFIVTEAISFVGGYVVTHEKMPISLRINEYEENSRTLKCVHMIHNFVKGRQIVSIEQFKQDDKVLKNLTPELRKKVQEAIANYSSPTNKETLWKLPLCYPYFDPVTQQNTTAIYIKSDKAFSSVDTLLFRDEKHVSVSWSVKGCDVKVSPYLGSLRCVGRDMTHNIMLCTPKDTQQEDLTRLTWDDAVALDVSVARPALNTVERQQREIEHLQDKEIDMIDFQIISVGERVEMESLGKRKLKILPNLNKYRWYIAVGLAIAIIILLLVIF
jgi:hypothetical protein